MNRQARRLGRLVACGLLLAAVATLGACGKKGKPTPPEGQESEYTYPRFYPAPLPRAPVAAEAAEEEEDAAPPPGLQEPPRRSRVSPFPLDRSEPTTRTYGTISRE